MTARETKPSAPRYYAKPLPWDCLTWAVYDRAVRNTRNHTGHACVGAPSDTYEEAMVRVRNLNRSALREIGGGA